MKQNTAKLWLLSYIVLSVTDFTQGGKMCCRNAR